HPRITVWRKTQLSVSRCNLIRNMVILGIVLSVAVSVNFEHTYVINIIEAEKYHVEHDSKS
ncbi:hypothetical protein MKW98_014018, partial [Papaver atlanticum]